MSSNGHLEDIRNKGRSIRRVVEAPDPVNGTVAKGYTPAVPNPRGTPANLQKYREEHPDHMKKLQHMNSKMTPENIDTILSCVRAGNYFTTAARLANISINTIYQWIAKGKDTDDENDPYHRFYLDLMEAEAEAEVNMVHLITTHAIRDWRPGMELLSRRYPERWSAKNQTQLTGAAGGPVELVVMFEDGDE